MILIPSIRSCRISVVLLAVVILAGCTAGSGTYTGESSSVRDVSASYAQDPEKVAALYTAMQKLWSDHVFWTRLYIISAVDGRPDKDQAAARLLKNQDDIGNAIAAYYGREAGDQLAALLKDHINIAVKLIDAAKAGDTPTFDQQNTLWKNNAEDIATFLSIANPHWPKATISEMMQRHLSTTTDEATARLNHDYTADVAAFDAVYDHILMMSDALSSGIVKQFPEKFE
jgi:hypothetical protein